MNGRDDVRRKACPFQRLAALFRHPEGAAEQRLGRRRSERDKHLRPHGVELGL
jgi:hypothetical protein